jgi:hypothetical protein
LRSKESSMFNVVLICINLHQKSISVKQHPFGGIGRGMEW